MKLIGISLFLMASLILSGAAASHYRRRLDVYTELYSLTVAVRRAVKNVIPLSSVLSELPGGRLHSCGFLDRAKVVGLGMALNECFEPAGLSEEDIQMLSTCFFSVDRCGSDEADRALLECEEHLKKRCDEERKSMPSKLKILVTLYTAVSLAIALLML